MNKILLTSLFLTLSISAFADESSPFYHLDNNWALSVGNTVDSQYSAIALGLDVHVLTNNNLWLNAYSQTYSNLTIAGTNSNLLNNMSGFGIGIKGGYEFILAKKYALIPNIGFSYVNIQDLVHTNSQPIFNYSIQSYNTSAGLVFEYAATKTLKFSLDSSLSYLYQNPVVPNSTTTISHSTEENYMLDLTPSISWNFYKELNASIFYQNNWLLTNNQPIENVDFAQYGINSGTIVDQLMTPPNTIGIKFGMLF